MRKFIVFRHNRRSGAMRLIAQFDHEVDAQQFMHDWHGKKMYRLVLLQYVTLMDGEE